MWEVRESQQTLGRISAQSLIRVLKARAKLEQVNYNSENGPENEPLGFVDFFFWDATDREVWLFLSDGNSWEQNRWRTFIAVIKKILGNFLDFSHGKKWKFLHLGGAKMSSVFLHLSVRRVKREKAKINLNSQSYTVTLYQFINMNWSSHWNLWRPKGLLRAPTLHCGCSTSVIFHLVIKRAFQCLEYFTVSHQQGFGNAPSHRTRWNVCLEYKFIKLNMQKRGLTTGCVLVCVENPSLTDLLAEFEARKEWWAVSRAGGALGALGVSRTGLQFHHGPTRQRRVASLPLFSLSSLLGGNRIKGQ